jgi:predicted N-acetyltransferase YhbS
MTDEFRLVQTDERTTMFDLHARAFKRGTASGWAASAEKDPWRDYAADMVGVSDGRVVAALRVVDRQIAGVEGELRMAGFGDVASDPAVRGQGYVRRLLAVAHERNVAAGYDLALLFTDQPWIYSGSAGFSALPFWWLDLDARRLPAPTGPWTIEAADPHRHLPGMQRVYGEFGQGRPGYPLRGDEYWTHPSRLTDGSWTRVALDSNERVAAYMRMRLASDGRAILQECPYISADAARALVADLAHDPVVAQAASGGGRLPRDHVLGPYGHWRTSDSAMARAYTASGSQLLKAILDPANLRTVYWSGDGF